MSGMHEIDLGHPLQHFDQPEPFAFELTPKERTKAAKFSTHLERTRREANKLQDNRDFAKLGIVFNDNTAGS
jgi:hypothetical protein